jgi:hypothetical protein
MMPARTERGPCTDFVRAAENALTSGDLCSLSDDDLKIVLTAAIKLYAAKVEQASGPVPLPIAVDSVTMTDSIVFVCEMIRAVDLNIFDLAMWQARVR